MLNHDELWLLRLCEIRLPDLEFQAESSLVDEATRIQRRARLERTKKYTEALNAKKAEAQEVHVHEKPRTVRER